MANKNTLRKRRANEKTAKTGAAVDSNRNGAWRPKLDKDDMNRIFQIRQHCLKVYGRYC